jgi:FdhE protein
MNGWRGSRPAVGQAAWDERIERADVLAVAYPFAAEVLHFYTELAKWQKGVYQGVEQAVQATGSRVVAGRLREILHLELVVPAFPALLELCRRRAPAGLAQMAAAMEAAGESRWVELLSAYWSAERAEEMAREIPESFFAQAILQPYAEALANTVPAFKLDGTPLRCPLCGALPLVSVLRPEGDGARRSLLCSLCLHEWDYRRLVCAYCGEESDPRLPVFVSEALPHLRVEACESCKHYLTGVNLAQDGRAVPLVDELTAIPLHLWAEQQGYRRAVPNLLRV